MKTQPVRLSLKHFMGVLLIVVLLAGTPAWPAAATLAMTRYVNRATGSDSGDCSSSPCATIGYAIGQASDYNIIQIAAGTYAERITVNKNLTFAGIGMDATILDGGGGGRVVEINSGKVVAFNNLTIQNGNTSNGGGGIENYGTLSLSHVKVANNTSNFGGGIYSSGALTMTDSIISGNNASTDTSSDGGGLALGGINSMVTLTRVTISGNTASLYSGGIHDQIDNSGGGSLTLTNVTISGNTAKLNGAMMNTNHAVTQVINSTIAGNHYSAAGWNGGIANYATIRFKNTIIAGNQDSNCALGGGTWTSLGNNLDSRNNCAFTATGDLHNSNPLLGALADNGGPTWTMALGAGSPAIDAGTNTGCPATDQRGISRPQGPHCDIGAYELVQYRISLPLVIR